MVPQRNISLVANALAASGAPQIPEQVIERDYVIAWFLTEFGGHALDDHLAFKGGTALRRCWFPGYRFSEDLDFTMTTELPIEEVLAGFHEIQGAVESASGIQMEFDRSAHKKGLNSYTFHLLYKGPLPAPGRVKVDLTLQERICFPLTKRPVLRQHEQFSDLPADGSVTSYSLEEVVLEKVAALSDRSRNEPRDLYDLWHVLNAQPMWMPGMTGEMQEKLAFRGRAIADAFDGFIAKEQRLRRLWKPRLSTQMVSQSLPEFDRVFRDVRRKLASSQWSLN